jgi:DMSO/TMAO reductase YedYZ molybdopterin-dependent catalytic subunit
MPPISRGFAATARKSTLRACRRASTSSTTSPSCPQDRRRTRRSTGGHCGDYTTNSPLEDVTGGRAWIAYEFEGEPRPGARRPARLLVPHLYFWKSAKWVRGLELLDHDQPGFWETYGYHNYGDLWKEQRYEGD